MSSSGVPTSVVPVQQVAVFVTSGAEGFSDPDRDRRESVTQVAAALSKKPGVLLVASSQTALIVVEIVSREGKTLNARLSAMGFTAPLAANTDGIKFRLLPRNVWKEAADNLADEVYVWIQQNQDKLK